MKSSINAIDSKDVRVSIVVKHHLNETMNCIENGQSFFAENHVRFVKHLIHRFPNTKGVYVSDLFLSNLWKEVNPDCRSIESMY